MSDPISPLRQWPAGIQQASAPANDNALRLEAILRPCLGVANDASGSDADGDVWLVGDTPAGAFANYSENDIALYQFASWYAWAPFVGARLVVDDARKVFSGTAWVDDPSIDSDGSGATVVTLAGTAYDMGDLTAGAWHVFTASGAVTITVQDDSVEPVPANAEYGLEARGTGGVTLVEDSAADIIPPKGGTLAMEVGDFAVLKRTAEDEYKLVGSTVAAS